MASNDQKSTFREYAQDIERAIQAAESRGLAGLPRVIAYSLLYATLRSQASNIPPEAIGAMAQLGQVERALEYAQLMGEGERKLEALWIIADVLQEKDQAEQAKLVLRQALKAIDGLQEGDKPGALAALTLALARLGDKEGLSLGLDIVSEIRDEDTKARGLAAVVQALIHAQDQGGLSRALAIVEEIVDINRREEAFAVVVDAMGQICAKEGLLQAFEIAERTWVEFERALALAAVVWAQGLARDKEGLELTLAASRKVAYPHKVTVLKCAAKGLAEAEDVDRALELVRWAGQESSTGQELAGALAVIGLALTKKGKMGKASEVLARACLAETIPYMIESVLPEVDEAVSGIRALARVGDVEYLRRVLDALVKKQTYGPKAEALVEIIKAMGELSDKEGLELAEVAATLPRVGGFRWAFPWAVLSWVWHHQLRELDKAKQVIGCALAVLYQEYERDRFGRGDERAEAFATLGEALVRIGETDKGQKALGFALEYLKGFTLESVRVRGAWSKWYQWYNIDGQVGSHYLQGGITETIADALAATMRGLIQLGDKESLARALQLTKGLKGIVGWHSRGKYQALTVEAEAMALTEWLDIAKQALAQEKTVETIATAALAQARFGDPSQAQDLLAQIFAKTRKIESSEAQRSALFAMGKALADVRDFDQALIAVRKSPYLRFPGGVAREDEVVTAIAAGLARQNKSERALTAAKLGGWRALTVTAIILAERGRDQQALVFLHEAVNEVEETWSYYYEWDTDAQRDKETIAGIAKALEAGQLDSALTSARSVVERELKIHSAPAEGRENESQDDLTSSLQTLVDWLDKGWAASVLNAEEKEELQEVLTQAPDRAQEIIALAATTVERMLSEWLSAPSIAGLWEQNLQAILAVTLALVERADRKRAKEILSRTLDLVGLIHDPEEQDDLVEIVFSGLRRLGDQELLDRTFAVAWAVSERFRSIYPTGGMREYYLRVIGQAIAYEAEKLPSYAVKRIQDALRIARNRGRDEVSWHVAAFAPALVALERTRPHTVAETWDEIQKVERRWEGKGEPKKAQDTTPAEGTPSSAQKGQASRQQPSTPKSRPEEVDRAVIRGYLLFVVGLFVVSVVQSLVRDGWWGPPGGTQFLMVTIVFTALLGIVSTGLFLRQEWARRLAIVLAVPFVFVGGLQIIDNLRESEVKSWFKDC